MTTESSAIDSRTVLPPDVQAPEDPFAEEMNAHYAKTFSVDVAAKRMGIFSKRGTAEKDNQPSRFAWLFKSLLIVLFLVPLGISAVLL